VYVESVNGKQGPHPVLDASDVGAAPADVTVQFNGSDDVDLTDKGNIILDKESKLLGTDPDGTEHVIGAISTYDLGGGQTLTQNELGNATNHTNINSIDRPTVEMPGDKKEVAFTDDDVEASRLPMATDADVAAGTAGKIVDARQLKNKSIGFASVKVGDTIINAN
jgi:hypothetical protein